MSVRPATEIHEDEAPDALQLAAAKEVLSLLVRALKMVRLYPAGNSVVRTTRADLLQRLEEYLATHGDLPLSVTRCALHLEGEPVHEDESSELNLALQLTLESVREITIHATVTRDEIDRFLHLLARLNQQREDVDDLETLFWQEDFEGISVLILDSFYEDVGDEEEFLEFVEDGGVDPDAVAVAAAERGELFDILGDATAATDLGIGESLGILDPEDHLRMEALLAEEGRRDPMTTFGAILVDVLGVEQDPVAFERLGMTLGRQIRILVEQKELLRAARIARHAEDLLGHLDGDDRRSCIETALANLSTRDVIEQLPDAVAEANDDGISDLRTLLSRLAAREPDAILKLLERSELRDLALASLQDHLDRLVPYLASRVQDPRPAVVTSVIRLLGGLRTERATAIIAEASSHEDIRVRIEAVRVAVDLPGGHRIIEQALHDTDQEVRLTALRCPSPTEAMLATLRARIGAKELAGASFLEKREVFHAVARGGGAEMVPFLAKILQRRPLFHRDRTDEIRACAASALGIVGTPEALEILDRHIEDRSDRVREASFGAMRDATRRRRPRRA